MVLLVRRESVHGKKVQLPLTHPAGKDDDGLGVCRSSPPYAVVCSSSCPCTCMPDTYFLGQMGLLCNCICGRNQCAELVTGAPFATVKASPTKSRRPRLVAGCLSVHVATAKLSQAAHDAYKHHLGLLPDQLASYCVACWCVDPSPLSSGC